MNKRIITICACLLFLFMCAIQVLASDYKFKTSSLSETEKEEFCEDVNLRVITDDANKSAIRSFDVAESGAYALAFEGNPNRIYVYDANGTFLLGYTFYSYGTYGIEFVDDNIAIYFSREQKIAIYSTNGVCIDVKRMDHDVQNYTYAQTMIERNYKKIGNNEYCLERNINIGPNYSKFVVINEQGERLVLYDVSADHIAGQLIWIAGAVGIFALVFYGVKDRLTIKSQEPN